MERLPKGVVPNALFAARGHSGGPRWLGGRSGRSQRAHWLPDLNGISGCTKREQKLLGEERNGTEEDLP